MGQASAAQPLKLACRSSKTDAATRLADERAAALGFARNGELAFLSINCTDDSLPGWRIHDEEELPIGGGKITPEQQEWLRQRAKELCAESPPTRADYECVGLLRTQVRYRGTTEFRLDADDDTNDRYIVALESHGEPEAPFPKEALGRALIAYERKLPEVIMSRRPTRYWSGCGIDRLAALGEMLGYAPVDRTGTWSIGLKLKILHPIPRFDPDFRMSLEDVFSARCKELLAKHPRLHLLWSGGVDSTSVLVAFLRNATSDDWQSRLSVHYDEHSIAENPRFFKRFIKPLPMHSPLKGHVRDFIDGTRVVVTGDPADMLFGTIKMADAFKGKTIEVVKRSCYVGMEQVLRVRNPIHYGLENPWQTTVPAMLRVRGLLEPGKEAELQWLAWAQPQVEKAPIPIVTLFDWLWWITYSCKFQFDLTRLFYNRTKLTPELLASVESFFDAPAWHQWAFHNHAAKMQDKMVWASYKQPLKAWIRSFDGDEEYYRGKTKVQSSRSPWGYQLGIDDKLNVIHFGWLSASRLRLQQKYGDALKKFVDEDAIGTQGAACL